MKLWIVSCYDCCEQKEIFWKLSAILKKILNKEIICAVNTYGYRAK